MKYIENYVKVYTSNGFVCWPKQASVNRKNCEESFKASKM